MRLRLHLEHPLQDLIPLFILLRFRQWKPLDSSIKQGALSFLLLFAGIIPGNGPDCFLRIVSGALQSVPSEKSGTDPPSKSRSALQHLLIGDPSG
jgi:hypothetical protein